MCSSRPSPLGSRHGLGQVQSGGGGQGQAHAGDPGHAGGSVTQVGVAACLGHGVNGGVGAAAGEVNVFGMVAFVVF